CQHLRTSFLRGREAGHNLGNAADLIAYSLRVESQRALERELRGAITAAEPSVIYASVDSAHGLLRTCFQNCIVTLLQAFDRAFDARLVFPTLVESFHEAQQLRSDLWSLRRYFKDVLERREELQADRIAERLALFRQSSLRILMFRDWEEF